jgi:hypothetical protein
LDQNEKPYKDDDDKDSDDSDSNDEFDDGDDADDHGNDGGDELGLRARTAGGGGAPRVDGGGDPSVHSGDSMPDSDDQVTGKPKTRFEQDLQTLDVLQGIAREMNDKATLIMLENQTDKLRRQLRRGDVADRAVADGFLSAYKSHVTHRQGLAKLEDKAKASLQHAEAAKKTLDMAVKQIKKKVKRQYHHHLCHRLCHRR